MTGLEQLYQTKDDFKNYVDKYARDHKLTIQQALTVRMVSDYADYLEEVENEQIQKIYEPKMFKQEQFTGERATSTSSQSGEESHSCCIRIISDCFTS